MRLIEYPIWAKTEEDKDRYRAQLEVRAGDQWREAARRKLRYAVKKGRIKKAEFCEHCGRKPKSPQLMHGHHHDYSQPFNVKWLCYRCHPKVEARQRLLRIPRLVHILAFMEQRSA